MARIYQQKYIEEIFKKENCLLVGLYTGLYNNVDFICSCGIKDEISLRNFRTGKRCKTCNVNNKKKKTGKPFTFEFVKEYFKSKGCTLLETNYINATQDISYICSCGEKATTKFKNFKKGSGLCNKCAREKSDESRRISDNEIIDNFKKRGCKALTIQKKGNHYFVDYICHCGEKATSYYTNFLRGHDCLECKRRKFLRENHFNWNPNLTKEDRENGRMIEGYEQWRDSVFKRDNFTCQCCGSVGGRLRSHHRNNYANFPELRLDTDNGVTLCEDCHTEFHSIYGYKDNTKEQYDEFQIFKKQQPNNPTVTKSTYVFKEKTAASKYRGVTFSKGKGNKKWIAVLHFNNKTFFIGRYYTEIEAAAAYNLKAIEVLGEELAKHRLNDVDHENIQFQETIKSSKYKGVSARKGGKWGVVFWIEGKTKSFGSYETEEEAAMVYNINALKYLGENVELNPVDHTKYIPPKKNKYFGVYYEKRSNRYRSFFFHNKIRYNLGYFDEELEAAIAYDKKAFEVMGDTRKLNFPQDYE